MSEERPRAFWPFELMAAVVVVFLAIMVRVLVSGYSDLATARAAWEARLFETAVEFYGRAARWYLPLVGAHREARQEMFRLCQESEGHDAQLALRCYRGLRGAILATRWLITPDRGLLGEANVAIARIVARERREDGSPILPESLHLELLERDETPNPWVSALAVLFFLGWLGVATYGFWCSIRPDGTVIWRRLVRYMGLALVLVFLWLLALRLA